VDALTLNYSADEHRSYIGYENAAQFEPLVKKQAADAAMGAERLRSKFSTIWTTASELVSVAEFLERQGRPGGWPTFDAAIASGLCGDLERSRSFLKTTITSFENWGAGST
jgi:hypothetical protein